MFGFGLSTSDSALASGRAPITWDIITYKRAWSCWALAYVGLWIVRMSRMQRCEEFRSAGRVEPGFSWCTEDAGSKLPPLLVFLSRGKVDVQGTSTAPSLQAILVTPSCRFVLPCSCAEHGRTWLHVEEPNGTKKGIERRQELTKRLCLAAHAHCQSLAAFEPGNWSHDLQAKRPRNWWMMNGLIQCCQLGGT